MTSTESGEEYASRRLFVIGTGHYASAEYEDRTRIPKVLGQVVDLLAPFDFQVHFATLGYLLDPDRTTLRDKIRQARATADLVVIYYTGHGEYINHEGYHLITTDFTETDLPEAGVKVVDLPVWIAARNSAGGVAPQQAPTLVILDCCFSGTGAIDLLHDAVLEKRANPAYANLWMWATAGNLQWADAGLFPDALAGALAHIAIGASTREIPLMTLLDQVNATLRTSAVDQESEIIPPNGRITSSPPFFPNPDHLPNVAGMTVDAQHWISKARGTESPATGFYLAGRSGRVQAARDLIQWILDPGRGGLAVVTGSPGTGKSTLLALPAILTDHVGRLALLNQTNTESLAHQTATLLPQDTIILAVHARGLNVDQIAARIAKLLARTASGVATLIASLSDQPPTSATTILIDALDEGNDHELIRDILILELVRHGIPVIVGVRPSVLLPTDLTTITIDLDEDPYHDPEALTDYIEQLLVAAHEPELRSPYRLASGQPHPGTRTIAAAIASRATSGQVESFLIARVVALALRARPTPVDPTDADWSDQLPAGLEGAFEEDISRLAQRTPAARVLLEALAWARGPGMPWETLWVPVAQALARLHSDPGQVVLPSDDDVRKLLADAGAYVVEDLGPGQRSVFRPFHGLLAEYLRNSRRESAAGVNVTRVEDSITNALLGTVPNDNQRRRRWGRAHPYLHTYLAGHALPTGHFDELLAEGGFLATADPATLMPLLVNAKPASHDVVRVYRRARSQLGDDPQANTAYLYEAATAVRARESIGDTGYRPLYDTRWSLIRADNSQLTLTAHTRPLNAVALATAIRAQLMLASAGDDGAIRLWNPDTGSEIGDPITGHAQTVQALAFGTSTDDRPVLASAGGDGIRFWNPYSGLAIGDPLVVPRGAVRALAFGTSTDDRPVFASAGGDGTIRLWNPDNGLPIGDPLVVPRGAVRALALGTNSQGRLILAYGGADGTIRLRNPETGKAIGEPLRGHRGPIRALAFGTNSGGLSMLASAGRDGTVRLWHPDTGRALTRPLRGHHGLVNAVAFGATTDRHAFLASAGDDHTIRLWDPDTGKKIGKLMAHSRPVRALAFGATVDGRSVLASAGDDHTIRLWDPDASIAIDDTPQALRGPVRALAFGSTTDGRTCFLASAGDANIALWNPELGKAIGKPLRAHSRPIRALAFGTTTDGRTLLASAGDDRTIQLWNPKTGKAIGKPLRRHRGPVRALAFGTTTDNRPVLASAGHTNVFLWNLDARKVVGNPLKGHRGPLWALAFGTIADSGLVLASAGDDRTIRLWNPDTGDAIGEPLHGHDGPVRALAFGTTTDNRPVLASAGDDRTIRLWNPDTGDAIGEPLHGHDGPVRALAFGTTTDNRPVLASGGDDRIVQLWDSGTGTPAATVHRRVAVNTLLYNGSLLTIGDDEGMSTIEMI